MKLWTPALVSITFRTLTPAEIINLALEANLAAIEWGGDVHVPPDNVANAVAIGDQTREAGLKVCAYGSYYRLDESLLPFSAILDTALALQAPVIRVWAGQRASTDVDEADRQRLVDRLNAAALMAAEHGLDIALEFHANTLTDTTASTLDFLDRVPHPNVYTNWQPPNRASMHEALASLLAVKARLRDLHVFHWTGENLERRPLTEGADRWLTYLKTAQGDRERYAGLEFVQGNEPRQCIEDARTLNQWLASLTDQTA